MRKKDIIIGQEQNLKIFKNALSNVNKGKGCVISVSGDAGSGKTASLKMFLEECRRGKNGTAGLFIEGQLPIGKFMVGSMQPMRPFSKAIDDLINKRYVSPEKKLALNMGLTLLTAIPLAGDAFYAAKELGKDWRQFKKDRSSANIRNVSTAAADYYDTICSYADKAPLVLLFDDFHFADAQSVELMNYLVENIIKIPLVIVFSYKASSLEDEALPLLQLVGSDFSNKSIAHKIVLKPFSKSELNRCCRANLPEYSTNEKFEQWLMGKSFGVPGIVMEYLRYFQKNNPFESDGSFNDNVNENKFLPPSAQSAFSQIVGNLGNKEKNTLAICSAEGAEFTVFIISQLLNTDVLSAIKKLRVLQNKTGIIRSIGPHYRYGVKTTVYRFTQAFYHDFFENSLEYEESQAIHGRIASLLKEKYEETDDAKVREAIAPYLAAHSVVSGDEELARKMMLYSAKASQKYGSPEVIRNTYESYQKIGGNAFDFDSANDESEVTVVPDNSPFKSLMNKTQASLDKETTGHGESPPADLASNQFIHFDDFLQAKNSIVKDFHNENYFDAATKANEYLEKNSEELKNHEKILLLTIAARAYTAIKEYNSATKNLNQAMEILDADSNPQSECFVFNSFALLHSSQQHFTEAIDYLRKAAKKAMFLPPELRLLTLSNIGLVMQHIDPAKASRYLEASRKLTVSLNFDRFEKDVFGR